MARGIEHRTAEGVLDAYRINDDPNFAIFSGTEIMMGYDGDDLNIGEGRLSDILNTLDQGGSSTTFTLRIYPVGTKGMTNKTPYKASTTFMLNGNQPVRSENGIMVLDRGNGQAPARTDNAMIQRLDNLERLNREMQEKLHKAELDNIKQNFEHQIAGLRKIEEEKPDIWSRIGESLADKPENIDRLVKTFGDLVGNLIYAFKGKKDFINHTAPVNQVRGTNNVEQMAKEQDNDQETEEIPTNEEGALINPYLSAEQQHLKQSAKYPIVKAALEKLNDEQLDNLQMVCVEVLEKRTSKIILSQLLLTMACVDNEDLNKILNNLC